MEALAHPTAMIAMSGSPHSNKPRGMNLDKPDFIERSLSGVLKKYFNPVGLTLILSQLREKGQIELCDRHAEAVIAREQRCGFEIFDHRDWR
jgi:hypothetical protein